jgi:hypothetical protein
MVGRLFIGISTSSGEGAPTFCGPDGLKHSFPLARYIRKRFNVPEDSSKEWGKTDFWEILQRQGYTLESLYAQIESDVAESGDGKWALDDFEAIVRTAVTEPNSPRESDKVCGYHRMLCESLEPGDYIINFNWDTLMADAMLFHSHYWFPVTGFGLNGVYPLMRPGQKRQPLNSLVNLFHVHGAVCLFEWIDEGSDANPRLLYLGPSAYAQGDTLAAMMGIARPVQGQVASPTRKPSEDEQRWAELGYVFLDGEWFKPTFAPPSKYKLCTQHWYAQAQRCLIHTRFHTTKRFIVAGYSFPDADAEHLAALLPPQVIHPKAQLVVVNPSNDKPDFRRRVSATFPTMIKATDYTYADFREFCQHLEPHSRGGE